MFCPSCGAVDGSRSNAATQSTPTAGPEFEPTQVIPATEAAASDSPTPDQSPVPVEPVNKAARQVRSATGRIGPSQTPVAVGVMVVGGALVLALVLAGVFARQEQDAGEVIDPVATTGAPADQVPTSPVPDDIASTNYEGACFAAVIPDGWELAEDDGVRSYGRRTAWRRGADELFVDSSPISDPAVTGKAAADEQLGFRTTATSGLIEEPFRDDTWSYTYTRSGVPSIATYFIDGRGYGVVASSRADSQTAMADARSVVASIVTVDPTC